MRTILHVEDDEDILNVVNALLTNSGYDVTSVPTGGEGLSALSKTCYNLTIIDIMLPDMSGWDFLKEAKAKCPNGKFIFLSCIPISDERRKCLARESVSDYIVKPFRNKDLVSRIHGILKRKNPE